MAPSIQKAAALPARQAHQIMAWHSCSLCGQNQSLWKACHGLLKARCACNEPCTPAPAHSTGSQAIAQGSVRKSAVACIYICVCGNPQPEAMGHTQVLLQLGCGAVEPCTVCSLFSWTGLYSHLCGGAGHCVHLHPERHVVRGHLCVKAAGGNRVHALQVPPRAHRRHRAPPGQLHSPSQAVSCLVRTCTYFL